MAACAILYLPSLFWTLGLDQNIFAEIGSLILHGKKLYVDAWDVKPPNVFYVYAFFESLFGRHDFAVRISDYLFSLLGCAAIFAAAQRQAAHIAGRGKEWIAPLASVLLMLTLLSLGLADTAQTESYSLCFLIGASFLAQPLPDEKKKKYPAYLFYSGILIGIATFFKTTNAVFFIAIAAEIWIYNAQPRPRALLVLFAGFCAWCVLQMGMLAISGSFSEYFRIAASVLVHHPNEVSSLHFTDVPRALWTYLDVWSILAIIAIVCAALKKDGTFLRSTISPVLLLAAGIISVLIQKKGWGYHYVVILPGLARLCAISATYLYRTIHARARRLAMLLMIAVAVATLVLTPSARRRIRYTREAIESVENHSAYLASLGAPQSLYYPPRTDSLAAYLRSHTSQNDDVFILGDEPGAYWRANRTPATKYVYDLLFTSGVISSGDLRAMQDTLQRKKPILIVVERFDTTHFRGIPETSMSLMTNDSTFAPLRELLATSYRAQDTVCKNFVIYARKDSSNYPQ